MKVKGQTPNLGSGKAKKAADAKAPSSTRGAGKAGTAGASEFASGGSVHLSSAVEEVREIVRLARAEDDVRPDLVAQAKEDLAAGRLDVDPVELAKKIAPELFFF